MGQKHGCPVFLAHIRCSWCTLIMQQLKTNLLHLACRHHIFEIMIEKDFVMCSSFGPEVALFKQFQQQWQSIDHSKFTTLKERDNSDADQSVSSKWPHPIGWRLSELYLAMWRLPWVIANVDSHSRKCSTWRTNDIFSTTKCSPWGPVDGQDLCNQDLSVSWAIFLELPAN